MRRSSDAPQKLPFSRPVSTVGDDTHATPAYIHARLGPQSDTPSDWLWQGSSSSTSAPAVEDGAMLPPPPRAKRPPNAIRRKSTPTVPSTIRLGASSRGSVFDLAKLAEEEMPDPPIASASLPSSPTEPNFNPLTQSCPPSARSSLDVSRHSLSHLTVTVPSFNPSPSALLSSTRSKVALASNRWPGPRPEQRRAVSTPAPSDNEPSRATKRMYAIKELLVTEKEYMQELAFIDENFYRPLLAAIQWNEPLCDTRTLKDIFANFTQLFQGAKSLAEKLDGRPASEILASMPTETSRSASRLLKGKDKAEPTPADMGTAVFRQDRPGAMMLDYIRFLSNYVVFMQNQPRSLAKLAEMNENPRWKNWIRDGRRTSRSFNLASLLLTLCQRPTRYRLILINIRDNTSPQHPDFEDISRACVEADMVANKLDKMMREQSTAKTVINLQRSFVNLEFPLIAPGRQLVTMGRLSKADLRGEEQLHAYFLFSDMLLCATVDDPGALARSISIVTGMTDMVRSKSRETPASDPMLEGKDGRPVPYRLSHRFMIDDVDVTEHDKTRFDIRTSQQSYRVTAPDAKAKEVWITSIRETRADYIAGQQSLRTEEEADRLAAEEAGGGLWPTSPTSVDRPPLPSRRSSSASSQISPRASTARQGRTGSPRASMQAHQKSAVEALHFAQGRAGAERSKSPPLDRRASTPTPSAMIHSTLNSPSAEPAPADMPPPVAVNYVAPIWISDAKVTECPRCGLVFRLFDRRHHCRLCGGIYCHACSSQTFIIPAYRGEPEKQARACSVCFDSAFTEYDALTLDHAPVPSTLADAVSALQISIGPATPLSNASTTPTDYFSRASA